ncbi:MAG TPA: efflux RND transporter periplasmic adaptor subunit [Mariniphaga sp.]|nr:efflux RND transporter periplasmic adaptor subunit [Mariniphaga sp.]
MKQKTNYLPLVALATMLLVSCSSGNQNEQAATTESERKEIVEVVELKPQTVARTVEYPATLEAYEEVHLAPASPGRIEKIHAEIGDRVSKGSILVEMDRTQLRQAEIQLKNLEADFRRLDTLAKYGSIAKQQYDQLQTQMEVAKSNVEFLTDNVRLYAPFTGLVSGRYYESGEMYSGAPNTPAGKAAVLSLVQIDRLKVMVSVSEGYFPSIKRGMETAVKIDVLPGRTFTGKVERIHPTIDPSNRTFNAEVIINNSENLLRPGMFARIAIDIDEVEAVLVPSMAVLKMQGSNNRYLFIEENGVARRIGVTIGNRYDDLIEVYSEQLDTGDRVIITGQGRLMDGVPIDVVNQ